MYIKRKNLSQNFQTFYLDSLKCINATKISDQTFEITSGYLHFSHIKSDISIEKLGS